MDAPSLAVVSDQETELARAAKEAFDNHRYESCLSTLNKLLELRRDDPRVAHNRAVAQYLLTNLTKTDEFFRNLQAIEAQTTGSNGGQISIAGKSVLLFNQALIHQRLRQNWQAKEILEQLDGVSDFLSEQLAVQVSLLLIEVYITTYQLDKASHHLEMLENKLFKGPPGGSNSQRDKEESGNSTSENDQYKYQIHQFKARLHLLHKNIKQCKKEVKCLTSLSSVTPCGQFLKATVEYLRGNYRKALKVLSTAPKSPIVTDAGECLSSFLFNNIGCIHFEIGRYSLATHYFRKAVEENDAALNGYPPLDRAMPLSGRPLSVLGVNCRHVLLYNLGLQQLYSNQPAAAFDSLLEVLQVYHANPRLWLRLAEACIAAHAKAQYDQIHLMRNKSETVQVVLGTGLHQKLVLTPMKWKPEKSVEAPSQSAAMPAPTLEFAAICLRNALFLLPSASSLAVAQDLSPIDGEEGGGDHSSKPPSVSALPGVPIVRESIEDLRSSVLACQAYTALGLGDPVTALQMSQQLLQMSNLPGGLKFVAHLYAAEALILLDRVQDALQHLNPESVTDISTLTPSTSSSGSEQETSERCASRPTGCKVGMNTFPTSVAAARMAVFMNLCSVYCIKKEYDSAKKALQAAISLSEDKSSLPPQAVLLSAYIEIMTGNTTQAIQVIKKHHPRHH